MELLNRREITATPAQVEPERELVTLDEGEAAALWAGRPAISQEVAVLDPDAPAAVDFSDEEMSKIAAELLAEREAAAHPHPFSSSGAFSTPAVSPIPVTAPNFVAPDCFTDPYFGT